ncbi:MAG: Gldg family protein [bacterium]|nr:Gldg family protein [bacterium]
MRREHTFLLQVFLLFFLLLALVVQTGRILARLGTDELDLNSRSITSLSPTTIAFLDSLQSHLAITYFVSSKETMPAHLKGVEAPVRAFLGALKGQAPDKIDIRVMELEISGALGQAYASRKKASPFSVREILRDEHNEQKVWSSLVLSYDNHPEILIQKITPQDLPYLEEYVLKSLQAQAHPIRPTIVVSVPPGFTLFTNFLKQYGDVLEIDLERHPAIPPKADLLFWMDPIRVTPAHLDALQKFVDTGHTAFLGGSAYGVDYQKSEDGQVEFVPYRYGNGWEKLLAPWGILPRPDLLLDETGGPVFFRAKDGSVHQADAAFHLRVMPGFYHLKGFLSPARGALNFVAASPLEIDPRKTSEAGFQVELLGTTTEKAWVQALPTKPFSRADLSPQLRVGKQNVMLMLNPEDPWRGQVVVLGTSSLFRDGIINQPNYGHRVFLQTVMRSFTESQRLVKTRVHRPHPPTIPPLKSSSRIFWRGFTVFFVPFLFLILGVRRYFATGGEGSALKGGSKIPIHFGIASLILLICSLAWNYDSGLYLDTTQDRSNTPMDITQRLLTERDLQAELILPPRANLPVHMKHLESTITSGLKTLNIPYQIRRPESLSRQLQTRLQALGLHPFEVQTVRDDAKVSRHIWSGLLLRQASQVTAIPRLDHRTLDHLEFLLVSGAQRLETGRAPHIGLIAEPPRLSPAEALEYHQKSLSPPKGADVFSEVKTLLRNYGYRITYINPRNPHLPDQLDLLIWFQPRRDISRMTQLLSQHLASGGKAIVALQHFNIQQRQYRGTSFQTVYWPQPQYQDLNQYLIPLGVEQIREVLMDRTKSRLALETQINRRAVREYEAQEVTQPFLIRAVGPNFSPASPITKNLGDQLFIWGNRFAFKPDSLNAYQISSEILVSTSNQAWSYAWKGGWLPDSIFTTSTYLPDTQPLAVLLEGSFPLAEFRAREGGTTTLYLTPGAQPDRGALLLIGSSEMFKNKHLYTPGFQHEQFLLNTTAHLIYGPEFTALQARRKIAQGFPFQPPGQKTLWRILVVGLGPLVFLAYGFCRWHQNRRIPAESPINR